MNSHAQYCLPYYKSNPFYCGTDVIFTTQNIANPVVLLRKYVSWHDHLHGAKMALFLWESGSHPSRSWFDLKPFAILDCHFRGILHALGMQSCLHS